MKQKGFTLIELLVVISIIALLSSVLLVGVTNTRAKARDTVRISNVTQLAKALEVYNDKNGQFPVQATTVNAFDVSCGHTYYWELGSKFVGAINFLQPLIDDGIVSKTPKEEYIAPIGGLDMTHCGYKYLTTDASGNATCAAQGFKKIAILYVLLEQPRPVDGAALPCYAALFPGSPEASVSDPNGYMVIVRGN